MLWYELFPLKDCGTGVGLVMVQRRPVCKPSMLFLQVRVQLGLKGGERRNYSG